MAISHYQRRISISLEIGLMQHSVIPCGACISEVSHLAETCPKCGHPNDWVHPQIKKFLSIKDNAGTKGYFNYTHDKLRLQCKADGSLPWWYWVGLVGLVVFINASIVVAFIAGLVWTCIGFACKRHKILNIDFSQEKPVIENNDKAFWDGLLIQLDVK